MKKIILILLAFTLTTNAQGCYKDSNIFKKRLASTTEKKKTKKKKK